MFVPVTTCNLQCDYCFIAQNERFKAKLPEFKYSPEQIGRAFNQKRLGGVCHINICGGGETMLPPQLTPIVNELLKQGHYIMIVTNGTVSKRFDEILQFDTSLLKRLGFKFSFHYEQFIKKGIMDIFLANVNKVKQIGCSYSIEMTPYDELIPKIPEIKQFCIEHFGAPCHVTVARNTIDKSIPILTSLSRDEYYKTWDVFDSELFRFKMSTFNEKRTEYCYAGLWAFWVNIGTGIAHPCYKIKAGQDIIKNPDDPIKFIPVGKRCAIPHCHNSHALLTIGCIPEMDSPSYNVMRDRITNTGEHWLNQEMQDFLSEKLIDDNSLLSDKEKRRYSFQLQYEIFKAKLNRIIKGNNKNADL